MDKRKIKYIVVHCTAGRETQDIADLRMEFARKGWKSPGYHYVVKRDGVVYAMHPEDKAANGVRGINQVSVHVAYIGGITNKVQPIDNRTEAQKKALKVLLKMLKGKYPDAVIKGHRDFAPKDCPCFDAEEEYKDL